MERAIYLFVSRKTQDELLVFVCLLDKCPHQFIIQQILYGTVLYILTSHLKHYRTQNIFSLKKVKNRSKIYFRAIAVGETTWLLVRALWGHLLLSGGYFIIQYQSYQKTQPTFLIAFQILHLKLILLKFSSLFHAESSVSTHTPYIKRQSRHQFKKLQSIRPSVGSKQTVAIYVL